MTTAKAYPLNVGSLQTYAEAHGTYPLKVLLANGYTHNAAHQYADDVTNELSGGSYARVTLSNVAWTVAGDAASVTADDPVFAAFTGTFDTVVFFADMGADSVSPLISHIAVPPTTSTAEAQTIDLPAGKIVTYNSLAPVLSVAGLEPDEGGDVPAASLAAVLNLTGGGSVEPIFVTAEASATLNLEDHYSAGRPVVVTIEGTSEETRPEVLWGDPADHVGQVVIHLPARSAGYVNGASVGWHIGPTPGVLGDLASSVEACAGNDLDFDATPETFELTIGATAYTATIDTDCTGDPVAAFTALVGGWITAGAPVTSELDYLDVIGNRSLTSALVTEATGAAATIEVTDAGTGDRLELGLLTATDGLDEGHEGYNGSALGTGELNAGQSNTHSWFDNAINALKSLVVMSDGTQWASVVRRHDAPMVPYTVGDPADWPEGTPAYAGNALDILAARAGGGGGGSVATDSLWDASGDLAVGSGANTAAKLTKGTSGTFLKAGASTLSWESVTKTDVGLANVTNDAQLKVASNLSDLASASTARNNLEATGTLAHRDGTTALTGTTTPTSLLASTITVPTMPVGSTLTVDVWGRYLNNTGANRSATVGVKLGSSTMIEMIPTGTGLIGSNASDREWSCTFICQLVGSSDVDAVGRSTAIGSTAAPNIVRNTTATAMQSGGTLDVIGTHSAATAAEIQVYGCVAKLSTPRS